MEVTKNATGISVPNYLKNNTIETYFDKAIMECQKQSNLYFSYYGLEIKYF